MPDPQTIDPLMTQIFGIGSSAALLGWVLLIFLPHWKGIAQAVAGILLPGLLSLAYAVLIAVWWSRGAGGFNSIEEVRALFGSTPLLVAGWLHYLAFDLFVGAWISREARKEGIPHLVIVPLLPLTLMFGPIGLLAYLLLRFAWRASGGNLFPAFLPRLAAFWGDYASRDRVLVLVGLAHLLAMIPTGLAYVLDDRTLNGVNVWVKPLKFEASLALFSLTLAYFMPMVSSAFRRSIPGRFVVWGFVLPALFESIYIGWRASMGEASHFNVGTPLASALYSAMGIGALMLTFSAPVLAWGMLRKDAPPADPAWRLAVVLGLVLTFALGAPAGMMMGSALSHSVGAPLPGDAGLPIVGWLRTAGDLRVGHFLGIHAQQLIPLAGALILALAPRIARPAIWGFAALYSAVTIATLVQARFGLPLIPA